MPLDGIFTFLKVIVFPFRKLILDLKDKRAATVSSDKTWLNAIMGGSSVLLSLLTLIVTLAKVTIDIPYFWVIRYGGLPLLSCVVLLMLITSRLPAEPGSSPILLSGGETRFSYRFAQTERTTAKLLFLPVAVLSVSQFGTILPNKFAKRAQISGYVCSRSEGTPIQGSIELLGMNGDTTSVRPEILDDHGFFVSDLRPWGFKPVEVRVFSISCPANKATLQRELVRQDGCVNDPNPIPQPTATATILIDCDPPGAYK